MFETVLPETVFGPFPKFYPSVVALKLCSETILPFSCCPLAFLSIGWGGEGGDGKGSKGKGKRTRKGGEDNGVKRGSDGGEGGGGRIKFLARGASKYTTPPLSHEMPYGHTWGEGGGRI